MSNVNWVIDKVETQYVEMSLKDVEDNLDHLPEDLAYEAKIIEKMLPAESELHLCNFHESIHLIYKWHLNRVSKLVNKQYADYVKGESIRGGGKLFQYISAEDKQFLNVHWTTHGDRCSGPEDLLEQQCDSWFTKWFISNTHNRELASEFSDFYEYVLSVHKPVIFDEASLDKSLKSYKKDTRGSDVFAPSALRQFPSVCKQALASAV